MTADMKKDVEWWNRFLPQYNMASIMWMQQCLVPDTLMASDSCLMGIGAIAGNEYIRDRIPEELLKIQELNIAHFELMAVLVGLRTWGERFKGKQFCIQCDNKAVVEVINRGSAKDKWLQTLLRLFAYQCAVGQYEVVAEHLMGELNRILDILSRWHLHEKFEQDFERLKQPNWRTVQIPPEAWCINEEW